MKKRELLIALPVVGRALAQEEANGFRPDTTYVFFILAYGKAGTAFRALVERVVSSKVVSKTPYHAEVNMMDSAHIVHKGERWYWADNWIINEKTGLTLIDEKWILQLCYSVFGRLISNSGFPLDFDLSVAANRDFLAGLIDSVAAAVPKLEEKAKSK